MVLYLQSYSEKYNIMKTMPLIYLRHIISVLKSYAEYGSVFLDMYQFYSISMASDSREVMLGKFYTSYNAIDR